MKRLITTVVTKEDAEGNSVSKHLFQIQGEDNFSANIVTFKVYDIQNKIIARDPTNPSTVLSETVYFDQVRKDVVIPDSAGGNACGRVFKSSGASEADIAASKKASNWYTVLFGEVTFPGSEPQLVNFRMPTFVLKSWYSFQDKIGRDPSLWPSYLLELKAKPQQAKPQFTEVLFSMKDTNLTRENTQPIFDEVNSFIQDHNNNILNKAA